jgi:hypothetical protein
MQSEAVAKPSPFCAISWKGSDSLGWEICRRADSIVVDRSTRLLANRIEATFDSARAAAAPGFAVSEPSSAEAEAATVTDTVLPFGDR